MIPTAVLFLTLAALAPIAQARRIERLTSKLDKAETDAANHLSALFIVLNAHARDVVTDPLGTDLWTDEPKLRVVES